MRFYATRLSKGTSEFFDEGELQIILNAYKIIKPNLQKKKLEWNTYILPLEIKKVEKLQKNAQTDLETKRIITQKDWIKEKNSIVYFIKQNKEEN
ncbi:hypothetical protein IQC45_20795 [Leptospira interrogans serovar Pomona]|nr:hypothetical protein [Leptospira interrogans serovar Pomona]